MGVFAVLKLIGGGILGFLKKIPWQVWAILGALFVVWRLYDYHVDSVEQAYSNGDSAGYSRAMGEVRDKAEQIRIKAETARRKAEAAAVDINEELRNAREDKAAALRDRANALKLRGPGRATHRADRAAANLPGVPGSTAGQEAGGAVDDRLAVVPWGPLVDFGVSHDQCQQDLDTWEAWYSRQKTLSDNWQPPPES